MKNITNILDELGIEIPEEKKAELLKSVNENYKTVNEVEKKIAKVEAERDSWKTQYESAEETLKGFEGVDLDKINNDLAEWKKKAEDAKADYDKQIAERDFNDALKVELEAIKFTSNSARSSIENQIKGAGLKLNNGKILGFGDLIAQLKESDPNAFVDEEQDKLRNNMAKFTEAIKGKDKEGKVKLASMSLDERMALKQSDPDYYNQLKGE